MEINIEEIKLNTKIQGDETLKTAPNSSTSSTINIKKDATIEDELVEASELKDDKKLKKKLKMKPILLKIKL